MMSHKISADVVRHASERGISHATWLLSHMYKLGIEVDASETESQNYLLKAVAQGSMHARRDLAFKALSGGTKEISAARALEMLSELADLGFDRTEIGEKLLLSKDKLYIEKGYKALKHDSCADLNWKARYLVSVFEAFGMNIPQALSDHYTALRFLKLHDRNPAAARALALAGFMGLRPFNYTHEQIAEELLNIGTAEAAIDALQMLSVKTFSEIHDDLRTRAFRQVQAHASAGHPHAQAVTAFQLLLSCHPRDEGICATRLLEILEEYPELHSVHFDYQIHNAKRSDPRLTALQFENSRKLAASGRSPSAFRTLGVELMMSENLEEAENYLLQAVNLGIDRANANLAALYLKKYRATGLSYDEALFWNEYFAFTSPEDGLESLYNLLELRKAKNESKATHQEIIVRKNCLEFLSRLDNDECKRELALLLIRGEGPVLSDTKRGLALLEEAAKNDGRAMYELAHIYQAGVFVPRDGYLAQHYFDLAAKNGHSNAQYDAIREAYAREQTMNNNPEGESESVLVLNLNNDGALSEKP